MHKLSRLSIALGVSIIVLSSSTISVLAQNSTYFNDRYDQFLNELKGAEQLQSKKLNNEPEFSEARKPRKTPKSITKVAPSTTDTKTDTYSDQLVLEGTLSRNDNGTIYLNTTHKSYIVFGKSASLQIVQSIGKKVRLTGTKAYHFPNGVKKLIGLSVTTKGIEYIESTPPIVKDNGLISQNEFDQSMSRTFRGEIYIKNSNPYLLVGKQSYRLLNENEWLIAFKHAYKGPVIVRGTQKILNGPIRYTSIEKQ